MCFSEYKHTYVFQYGSGFQHRQMTRLAPVHKTIFHQCVISHTCSQSNSDGSVLWTGSTSNFTYQLSGW